jgi:hypothetical protein
MGQRGRLNHEDGVAKLLWQRKYIGDLIAGVNLRNCGAIEWLRGWAISGHCDS